MSLILNLEVHRLDYLSALRIPVTITQRLSSDGKLRKLSVISTLTWLWKVLKIFFVTAFGKSLWWRSSRTQSAGHTNNKPAAGIFPPRSLTRQYDWLTKITWDITHAIPRVGEKTFGKIWVLQVLLKNSPQKSAEKLFYSLVCLLRSFSKDLFTGKRYFVEVAVNCVSALWASNRGVGSVGCATNFTKTSSS